MGTKQGVARKHRLDRRHEKACSRSLYYDDVRIGTALATDTYTAVMTPEYYICTRLLSDHTTQRTCSASLETKVTTYSGAYLVENGLTTREAWERLLDDKRAVAIVRNTDTMSDKIEYKLAAEGAEGLIGLGGKVIPLEISQHFKKGFGEAGASHSMSTAMQNMTINNIVDNNMQINTLIHNNSVQSENRAKTVLFGRPSRSSFSRCGECHCDSAVGLKISCILDYFSLPPSAYCRPACVSVPAVPSSWSQQYSGIRLENAKLAELPWASG
jgi:hypothetical protein